MCVCVEVTVGAKEEWSCRVTRKDDYFVENALTFKSLKCLRLADRWKRRRRATYVTHRVRSFASFPIHSPFGYDSIQFNCLFVVVILSFSFVAEEIYGKSERFIGFRAMGLRLFSLFFCFFLCRRTMTTAILFHRCHCSSRCAMSVENLLLFYYHFDKAAWYFFFSLHSVSFLFLSLCCYLYTKGKCYIFLRLRVWKFKMISNKAKREKNKMFIKIYVVDLSDSRFKQNKTKLMALSRSTSWREKGSHFACECVCESVVNHEFTPSIWLRRH